MTHVMRLQSLRTLGKFACLSLLLISLGGCANPFVRYAGVAPKLPDLPPGIQNCIKDYVKTPKGDWTVQMMADIVAKYRRREIKLEGCLKNVELFYVDLQRGLAKP